MRFRQHNETPTVRIGIVEVNSGIHKRINRKMPREIVIPVPPKLLVLANVSWIFYDENRPIAPLSTVSKATPRVASKVAQIWRSRSYPLATCWIASEKKFALLM